MNGKQTLARLEIPSLVELADKARAAAAPAPIHFVCPPSDMACIAAIVRRANDMGRTCVPPVAFHSMLAAMDIALVHCNSTPLRLERFLMSAPIDFMHDFAGIGLHVDRASGQLLHDWRPIFARQVK